MDERIYLDPVAYTEDCGESLAAGQWTADEAVTKLAVLFSGLNTTSHAVSEEVTSLIENTGDEKLTPSHPQFARLVKLATRGIVWSNPDEDALNPTPPDFLDKPFDDAMEIAVDNSTEGIFWIDPEAELYREKRTTQTATLLKAFREGLKTAGFPERQAKKLMREEIDGTLDELAVRTSYAAIYQLPVLSTIMSKAELGNFHIAAGWIRRLGIMGREAYRERKAAASH